MFFKFAYHAVCANSSFGGDYAIFNFVIHTILLCWAILLHIFDGSVFKSSELVKLCNLLDLFWMPRRFPPTRNFQQNLTYWLLSTPDVWPS